MSVLVLCVCVSGDTNMHVLRREKVMAKGGATPRRAMLNDRPGSVLPIVLYR